MGRGGGGLSGNSGYYDATVPLFGEETTAVKTFDIAFAVVTVVFVIVSHVSPPPPSTSPRSSLPYLLSAVTVACPPHQEITLKNVTNVRNRGLCVELHHLALLLYTFITLHLG
jgi:hypothetical protein